jgi:hypothetical protein
MGLSLLKLCKVRKINFPNPNATLKGERKNFIKGSRFSIGLPYTCNVKLTSTKLHVQAMQAVHECSS